MTMATFWSSLGPLLFIWLRNFSQTVIHSIQRMRKIVHWLISICNLTVVLFIHGFEQSPWVKWFTECVDNVDFYSMWIWPNLTVAGFVFWPNNHFGWSSAKTLRRFGTIEYILGRQNIRDWQWTTNNCGSVDIFVRGKYLCKLTIFDDFYIWSDFKFIFRFNSLFRNSVLTWANIRILSNGMKLVSNCPVVQRI